MATPNFQVQTFQIQPKATLAPNSVLVLTKAFADGSAVDVSSGYTFKAQIQPSANANPQLPDGQDYTSYTTLTGGATGITVMTAASFGGNVPYLQGKMNITASNDSGATWSLVGSGSFALPSF